MQPPGNTPDADEVPSNDATQLSAPNPAAEVPVAPIIPETAEVIRFAVEEANFGAGASTDESPTIISKTQHTGAPAPTLSNSLQGRRLAHFELLAPIGVGGMAAVIRARDTQLERLVALKILPPEMATNPEHIRRFQQEARAAAKLDHENIARVFYCGEDQRLHFIAFEFVEGENLRTFLERRGRLPAGEAIHYMLQIATGLDHAASRGVVHRDIKPSNIIITPSGRAKLVDMGLARSLETQGESGLTQSGVTLGTFDYISPEQALEPRDADARSDIYSLGCTFYHILTGQAPVPDGTAAKKLHHHQHVKPVDPRILVPDLPDAVAAVVARMMAKDPKDRYQKPEHLVQHLLQLAQQVAPEATTPAGVLFVDAPLPDPPRARPFLLAAVAVAVLIAIVLGLGQSGQDPPAPAFSTPIEPPGNDSITTSPTTTIVAKVGPAVPTFVAPSRPVPSPAVEPSLEFVQSIGSTEELAAVLKRIPATAVKVRLVFAEDLRVDVTKLLALEDGVELMSNTPLVLDGKDREWILEAKPGATVRPTLLLAYSGAIVGNDVWATVTVRGGAKATLRNLRLEVDTKDAPDINMTAILVQDGSELSLDTCELVQTKRHPASGRMASVAVEGGMFKPVIGLSGCFFAGGQDAVSIKGAAVVKATQCAFGRHNSLFHLRGLNRLNDSPVPEITLGQSSATCLMGPVFQLDDGATARLALTHTLLSHAAEGGAVAPAAVIWQVGLASGSTDFPDLTYAGEQNVYHRFTTMLARSYSAGIRFELPPATSPLRDFIEVRKQEQSTLLLLSPWKAEEKVELAPAELDTLLAGSRPKRAFAVNTSLRELRWSKEPQRLIGVENSVLGKTVEGELPRLPAKPVEPPKTVLIVDPAAEKAGAGIWRTLGQAVVDAQPGDVIQLKESKASRFVEIDPVPLLKPNIDLTIKAYEGHRPILTLGDTSDSRAALFQLHDGQLNLEGLEFQLRPGLKARNREFDALAVVNLKGFGVCSLKGCWLTLDPEGSKSEMAVVALGDPKPMRTMTGSVTSRARPEIRLDGCFVRGSGDFLQVRASQPFGLDLRQSLVALNGSLVTIDGQAEELSLQPGAQITLAQVTAYLTDHLVLLHAGKSEKRGLVGTAVGPVSSCLFVAARGNALIHLDGMDDLSDKQLKQLFSWTGDRTLFGNFSQLLDQVPRGEGMGVSYPPAKWKDDLAVGDNDRFEKVQLSGAPLLTLARSLPEQFRLKGETSSPVPGVNLDRLLTQLRPFLKDADEKDVAGSRTDADVAVKP